MEKIFNDSDDIVHDTLLHGSMWKSVVYCVGLFDEFIFCALSLSMIWYITTTIWFVCVCAFAMKRSEKTCFYLSLYSSEWKANEVDRN